MNSFEHQNSMGSLFLLSDRSRSFRWHLMNKFQERFRVNVWNFLSQSTHHAADMDRLRISIDSLWTDSSRWARSHPILVQRTNHPCPHNAKMWEWAGKFSSINSWLVVQSLARKSCPGPVWTFYICKWASLFIFFAEAHHSKPPSTLFST